MPDKRSHAIAELLSTEADYARGLQEVSIGYIDSIPDTVSTIPETFNYLLF